MKSLRPDSPVEAAMLTRSSRLAQRSLGITADRVFDQPFERSHKTWLARCLSLAPGPATPDATTDFIASGF
jgi:hypothetical protein